MALARLTSKCFLAFFYDDGDHREGSNRVGPPPVKEGVQKQATQQDYRKISADRGLPRVCMQGHTIQTARRLSFLKRQPRHDDQRKNGNNNSRQALVRTLLVKQLQQ